MQHPQRRHVGWDSPGDSDMAATAVRSSAISSPATDNIDRSPCSLDYSACSPCEVGATPINHSTAAITSVFDDSGRGDDFSLSGKDEGMGKEESFYSCFSEAFSPLGDSLHLSPFTPSEGAPRGETTITTLQSQNNDHDETNEKLGQVTLVIPWLADARDRSKLYGPAAVIARDPNDDERILVSEEKEEEEEGNTVTRPMFATQEEQEVYIRSWLANDAGMPEEAKGLNILFYPARFHKFYNSIFALGDICDLITNQSADVCILEEPEHLNWYRAPGKVEKKIMMFDITVSIADVFSIADAFLNLPPYMHRGRLFYLEQQICALRRGHPHQLQGVRSRTRPRRFPRGAAARGRQQYGRTGQLPPRREAQRSVAGVRAHGRVHRKRARYS